MAAATGLEVTVKIADTKLFEKVLELFREIASDSEIPKEKREHIVARLLEIGALPE